MAVSTGTPRAVQHPPVLCGAVVACDTGARVPVCVCACVRAWQPNLDLSLGWRPGLASRCQAPHFAEPRPRGKAF